MYACMHTQSTYIEKRIRENERQILEVEHGTLLHLSCLPVGDGDLLQLLHLEDWQC